MAYVEMRQMRHLTIVEPPRSEQMPRTFGSPLNHRGPPQLSEPPPVGPFRAVLNTTTSAPPTVTMRFWFRTRLIRATARRIREDCGNVFLVQLIPSTISGLIGMACGLLPSPLRGLVDDLFPEWSLPTRLILKVCKEGWDEEFENEKTTYHQIRHLQGIVVPKCYGECYYNDTRALLLSDIGGECMGSPAGAIVEMDGFRRMMRMALTDLARFGVLPDDIRLENFRVVGNRIMVVDFEMVRKLDTQEDVDEQVTSITNWLARLYQDNQRCFLDDGLIEPEKERVDQ